MIASPASSSTAPSGSAEPLVLTPDQTLESLPAVMGFLHAYLPCQVLYTVVRLKVPDAIGSRCLTVKEIVGRIAELGGGGGGGGGGDGSINAEKIRPEALYRCLRLLAANGFFEELATPDDEDGWAMYRLTPMGALLQTNVSGGDATQPSLACGVLHAMEAPMWEAWMKLDDYVMGGTDVAPWEAAHGMPIFDFYGQHEESSRPFNEFMSTLSGASQAVVTTIVPWAEYEGMRVVDVGGGFGTVAHAIKASFPKIDVCSLDTPKVVEQARATGRAPPEAEVQLVGGDMFDASTYPANVSAVLLKHILHDWDDDRCRAILAACHATLPEDGKVLVVDAVLPNPGEPTDWLAFQSSADALMMLIGGKERTKRQWSDLAASAGFQVESFTTASPSPNLMVTTLVKA
jgi:ubiquinone/menaquinone biosynthesis C-methylase UbiE